MPNAFVISPSHPKRVLLFFVAQDIDAEIRLNTRAAVLRLASLRNWLSGPPVFVDSREEPTNAASGDLAVETVGAYLEIYSTLPPWTLPREVEIQLLDDVTSLLDAAAALSREKGYVIEVELDGELVGAIEDGTIDRFLREGLLTPWKQKLGIE